MPEVIISPKIHGIYEEHRFKDEQFPFSMGTGFLKNTTNFIYHYHENPEIIMFKSGNSKVIIDNITFETKPFDVVFIPPNSFHKIISASKVSTYFYMVLSIEFLKRMGFEPENNFTEKRIHDSFLCDIIENISKEYETQDKYYKPTIASNVLNLFSYALRNYPELKLPIVKPQKSELEMIKQVFLYVENHYAENISIKSLAKYVNYSEYYFCHVFKSLTDITPLKYINYVRCKKARKLLTVNNLSVSQVAEMCGFQNLSYFSKTYKKFNGSLPSEDVMSKKQ